MRYGRISFTLRSAHDIQLQLERRFALRPQHARHHS